MRRAASLDLLLALGVPYRWRMHISWETVATPLMSSFSWCSVKRATTTCHDVIPCSGCVIIGPFSLVTTAVSAELGHHESLKGSSKAIATVTAIIDGFGSVGKLDHLHTLNPSIFIKESALEIGLNNVLLLGTTLSLRIMPMTYSYSPWEQVN